jgi:hypothetical protein
MLDAFHGNSAAQAAKLLADPRLAKRNDVALDRTGAWTMETSPVKAGILDVTVHFVQPISIGAATLIATGLELSRAEVTKHITADRAPRAGFQLCVPASGTMTGIVLIF